MSAKYKIGSLVEFTRDKYTEEEGEYMSYDEKYFKGKQGHVISVSDTKVSTATSVEQLSESGNAEYMYVVRIGLSDIKNVPESDLKNPQSDIAKKVEERLSKKQEGKTFKDTEHRVGGSKKEKMAYKMVSLSDLKDIEEDEATAIELVKKDKVYPKVDLTAEREKGVSSGCAFLKVKLREAFASSPPNNATQRKIYVGYAKYLFDATQTLSSVEEFDAFLTTMQRGAFIEIVKILKPELYKESELEEGMSLWETQVSAKQKLHKKLELSAEKERKRLMEKYPKAEFPEFYDGAGLKRPSILANPETRSNSFKDFEKLLELDNDEIQANNDLNRLNYNVPEPDLDDLLWGNFASWLKDIYFDDSERYKSTTDIGRAIFLTTFGKRFANFVRKRGDPVLQTFETAKDYEALSLPESLMLIDKYTKQTGIEKGKRLMEEIGKLTDRQSHDEFFKANSKWSFGGHPFSQWTRKRYFDYSDAKNVEQIEAFKTRYKSALEKEIASNQTRVDAIEKKYRARENNWDWAFGEKNPKEQKKKSDLKVNSYPPLSYIKRTGGIKITEEDIKPVVVTGADGKKYDSYPLIQKNFGFKSLQLGLSLKDKEAKEHIKHFLGAMADLGEMLEMNIAELNNLGGLSIAFASRGGGKASAHYEALRKIINVTKTRGGGAIAHEYMHYLDNILPKIDRPEYQYTNWASVYSESRYGGNYTHNLSNKEVFNSIHKIFNFIYNKKVDGVEKKSVIKSVIDANDKKYNLPKTFYTRGEDGSIMAQPTNIDEYWFQFRKSSYGMSYQFIENLKKRDYEIIGAIVKMYGFANYEFEFKTNKSIFFANSVAMGSDYWSRAWELFARAFETYIYDKLDKSGRANNYLVSGDYFDRPEGVYPQGEERESLFILYDELMKTIKVQYKIGDFKAWTTERVDEYVALEEDESEKTKAGVVVDAETGEVEEVLTPDTPKEESPFEFASKGKIRGKLRELFDLLTNEEMEAGGTIQNNNDIADKLNEFLLTLPN